MLVADLFGENRSGALAKINCPTLIIASAKTDELARQQTGATQVRAGLALHARFEKIEDGAHAVFLDQPERFDELFKKFLKGLTTAGSTP
jgi:non-heme chloroperoxidase